MKNSPCENAVSVWAVVQDAPGWASRLCKTKLTNDERESVERVADEMEPYQVELERELERFFRSMPYGVWAFETDQEIVDHLTRRIDEAYDGYGRLAQADVDYGSRQFFLLTEDVKGMEALRKKVRARMVHKANPDVGRVTEWQIVRAREYPLESLLGELGVEIDRSRKIICPFHADKNPSMWVKNGWGYCHSCGASCDSIRYLIDVEGYRFTDAIARLQ